jgi:hypothetical protein
VIGTPLMPALLASAGRRYSIQRFMKGRAGAFYTPDNPNTLRSSRTSGAFGGLSASSLVGTMLDVSRGATSTSDPGCHQVAPSDAARPVLEAFAGTGPLSARFNGTDRSMGSLTTLDLTSTDEVTVIAAVRSLADGANQVIAELSASVSTNNGAWRLLRTSVNAYSFDSKGTTLRTAVTDAFGQPDTALLIARAKISDLRTAIARNRAAETLTSANQGTGNYGNFGVFLGARDNASLRFNSQLGRLAIIGGALTAEELSIATGLVAAPYGL